MFTLTEQRLGTTDAARTIKRRVRGFAHNPSSDSPPVLSSSDEESTGGEQVVGDERGRGLHNGGCVSRTVACGARTVRRRSRGRRLLASDVLVCTCEERLGDCSQQSAKGRNTELLNSTRFLHAV